MIRALTLSDVPGLLAVQRACYGDGLIESAETFQARLTSPANSSLAVERQGRLCAYAAACRSRLGRITPLHGDFEPAPEPDTLYLHDLAVLPAFAGQGLAQALLTALLAQARADGLRHSALVAVQGAERYWSRRGYTPRVLQANGLAAYGPGAVYMTRTLE